MIPSEHEGTVAVDAAARKAWAGQPYSEKTSFDELDVLQQNRFREAVLPLVWAALEALPDRSKAALIEAAQDYREHVHDEHPDPADWGDMLAREGAAEACAWLERRADLIGSGG